MKRICIVRFGTFSDDPRVYKEVKALLEDGVEVDVVCLQETDTTALENSPLLRIHRLQFSKQRTSKAFYLFQYIRFFVMALIKVTVLFFLRKHRVIQVNNVPNFLVFVGIIPKLFGARIMLDMHEPMLELFREQFLGRLSPSWEKLLIIEEWVSVKFADQVIFVSEMVSDILKSRGFSGHKFTIIHNTPDETVFHFEQVKPRGNEFIVACHSTLLPRYGLQILIEASALLKDIPGIKIRIFGDGEYKATLEHQANSLGVESIVEFMGKLPFEQLAPELQQVDVGVVPLLKTDFTQIMAPNKLFEYVAMKKPVVASDLHGMRKYFPEETVTYFNPGDSLSLAENVRTLYRDPRLASRKAEEAFSCYQNVRWEQMKKLYCQTVTNLAN